MLQYLNEKISWRTLIWLSPIVFSIHDAEEIITMEPWLDKNKELLPELIRSSAAVSTGQFTAAVIFLLVVLIIICCLAANKPVQSFYFQIYVFAMAIFFMNGLTHIFQAIVFRDYTPGILTAVIELIPFSAYVLYRMLKEKLATRKILVIYSLSAIVLQGVLIVAAKAVGKLLVA